MKKIFNKVNNSKKLLNISILAFMVAISLSFIYSLGFSTNWAMFDNISLINGALRYKLEFTLLAQKINFVIFRLSLIAVIMFLLLIVCGVFKVKKLNIMHYAIILVSMVCIVSFVKYSFIDIQHSKTLYVTEFENAADFLEEYKDLDLSNIPPGFDWKKYNEDKLYYQYFKSSKSSFSVTTFTLAVVIGSLDIVVLVFLIGSISLYAYYSYKTVEGLEILEKKILLKEKVMALKKSNNDLNKEEILVETRKVNEEITRIKTRQREKIVAIKEEISKTKKLIEQCSLDDNNKERLAYKNKLKNLKMKAYELNKEAINILTFWRI